MKNDPSKRPKIGNRLYFVRPFYSAKNARKRPLLLYTLQIVNPHLLITLLSTSPKSSISTYSPEVHKIMRSSSLFIILLPILFTISNVVIAIVCLSIMSTSMVVLSPAGKQNMFLAQPNSPILFPCPPFVSSSNSGLCPPGAL
jgi:hypothetical protein